MLHTRASSTKAALFGDRLGRSRHDFPIGIAEMVRRSGGRLGSVASIIYEHTIIPYFLPFTTPEMGSRLLRYAEASPVEKVHAPSLWSSPQRRLTALRACHACYEDDVAKHRCGCWHLPHQYPGVLICLKHRQWLVYRELAVCNRYEFVMPEESLFANQRHQVDAARFQKTDLLSRIAGAVMGLASMPQGCFFELSAVRRCYMQALAKRNLITRNGMMKAVQCANALHTILMDIPEQKRKSLLLDDAGIATREVVRLIHHMRSNTHPLRHIILIVWLFEGWDSFISAYKKGR